MNISYILTKSKTTWMINIIYLNIYFYQVNNRSFKNCLTKKLTIEKKIKMKRHKQKLISNYTNKIWGIISLGIDVGFVNPKSMFTSLVVWTSRPCKLQKYRKCINNDRDIVSQNRQNIYLCLFTSFFVTNRILITDIIIDI